MRRMPASDDREFTDRVSRRLTSMSDAHKRPDRVLPDEPTHRPLERFWPYAELSEQPTRRGAGRSSIRSCATSLFGAPALPFSISVVFPGVRGRALRARGGAGAGVGRVRRGRRRRRAPASRAVLSRRSPGATARPVRAGGRRARIRTCWSTIGRCPYARELWLPLVWCLIR